MALPALPPSLVAHMDGPVAVLRLSRPEKRNCIDNDTVLGMETFLPRLFRRLPEVRYRGRLHPHFAPPLEELARQKGGGDRQALHRPDR